MVENHPHDYAKTPIKKVAKALGVKKQLLFYPPKIVEVLAILSPKLQEQVLAMTEQEVVRITKEAIENLVHNVDNRGRPRRK